MSDRPYGDEWWKASDGKWYPPEARPGMPAPPPPLPAPGGEPPRRPLSSGLTGTLQAFLYGAGAAGAAAAIATVVEIGRIDAETIRRASDVYDALGAAAPLLGLFSLAGVVAAVLMVVWMFQAYTAALQRGATGTGWSAGWAVGSWFIPFANLVIPKLVLNEIDRMSHPGVEPEPIIDRWRTAPTMAVSHAWWALLLAAGAFFTIGYGVVIEQIDGIGLDVDAYRTGLWVMVVGLAVSGAAGITGAAVVRTIGHRLGGRDRPQIPGPPG